MINLLKKIPKSKARPQPPNSFLRYFYNLLKFFNFSTQKRAQKESIIRLNQKLLSLVQQDINKRGVQQILPESALNNKYLYDSCQQLLRAKSVAILTGFQCNVQHEIKAENDGIAGSIQLAVILLKLGKEVSLLIDQDYWAQFSEVLTEQLKLERLYDRFSQQKIQILGFPPLALSAHQKSKLQLLKQAADVFVSIERPSQTLDGKYKTMGNIDITHLTSPIDALLFNQIANISADGEVSLNKSITAKPTICIGDGGNEIGMGNVYEKVMKHVRNGPQIVARTICDNLIVSDISNWGAYALIEALVTCSYYDQEPMNRSQFKDHAFRFGIKFDHQKLLYEHISEAGFRDGITKSLDKSVDGVDFQTNLNIIKQLSSATADHRAQSSQ